jgi:DMSO/TMAO reductase YedYZ molybdopterin-dependent catalytic subunit
MKLFICNVLVLFLFALSAMAQTSVKTEPVLRVEVENGKTLDLKAKDLAKFTRREAKGKDHDGKESKYGGVNLSDILLSAGAKIGKDELRGKEQAAYILIEAADGYKGIFSIAELSADFTDKTILLADSRDGKPLTEKEGFWQIIVPDEKKHGRWVRQVTTIKLVKIK